MSLPEDMLREVLSFFLLDASSVVSKGEVRKGTNVFADENGLPVDVTGRKLDSRQNIRLYDSWHMIVLINTKYRPLLKRGASATPISFAVRLDSLPGFVRVLRMLELTHRPTIKLTFELKKTSNGLPLPSNVQRALLEPFLKCAVHSK
jgi:hypothetical protein